jgi:cyclopropane fatty-acyl-phospholipid synthase-like methyltransferase
MGLIIILISILLILGIVLVGEIIALGMLLYSIPRGAPYAATDDATLRELIKAAKVKKGEKIIDVGSGDGKIVIALASQGIDAYGIEFNPLLVVWSRYRIRKMKLQKHATIYWGDMWRHDFRKYNVIIIYGIIYIMKRLEKKLRSEVKPGARVLCNHFQFPTWKPQSKKGRVAVYLQK